MNQHSQEGTGVSETLVGFPSKKLSPMPAGMIDHTGVAGRVLLYPPERSIQPSTMQVLTCINVDWQVLKQQRDAILNAVNDLINVLRLALLHND
jgi:hypothetical protein